MKSMDGLIEVCEACLHQLSTDSDLDNVTGAEKYRQLVAMLREVLEEATGRSYQPLGLGLSQIQRPPKNPSDPRD